MQVKQDINVYQFRDMFASAGRQDNFSYDALGILFDYLEECQESLGEAHELDVVALCCDYTEMTWDIVIEQYNLQGYHVESISDTVDAVRDYLQDNTIVCGEFTNDDGETTFIFQLF